MKQIISLMNNKKVKVLLNRLLIALAIFLLVLVFFNEVFSFILTVAIVIIASLSKIYKKFIHSIGFELVTFASIIFFFAYGPLVGFLLAMLMLIASTLISSRITQILTFQAIIYAIMAIMSIFMHGMDITTSAKVLVIIYNLLLHFVGIFIIHYPMPSSVLNFIVNVVTNFFIIDWTAKWVLGNL
jgi:hypothetical protein